MQKVATRIFIGASLAFGVLGILMVLTGAERGSARNLIDKVIFESFLITIFIILPSFALSVAGKYLNGNKQ